MQILVIGKPCCMQGVDLVFPFVSVFVGLFLQWLDESFHTVLDLASMKIFLAV